VDTRSIKESIILPCTPEKAFEAWMDSEKHGEMIEGNAKIENHVGEEFSIWDGAITGKTLELNPEKLQIVQEWRYEYDDWPKDSPSKIILEFLPHNKTGCKLQFSQTEIPSKYVEEIEKGWKEYYWEPMKKYLKD
jgi:activator of HSP90 ATPase